MIRFSSSVACIAVVAGCSGRGSQAGGSGGFGGNANVRAPGVGRVVSSSSDASSSADASAPVVIPVDASASLDADAPFDCVPQTSSTLDGAWIEFVAPVRCEFSLSEAKAGISIPYLIHFDHDIPDVMNGNNYEGLLPTGLDFMEKIEGGLQRYCGCDPGYGIFDCLELRADYASEGGWSEDAGVCNFRTLKAGVYPAAFTWDGRNWNGSSDTLNPEGPPFPPGDYTLEVNAYGYLGPSVPYPEFKVNANLNVRLRP